MASDDNDQDVEYALSKLLQMDTVEDYQREFEMLIKRVIIPESLLKSFYISGLKLDLQCLLLRSNPKTLDEAFSLARVAETRFANLDIWEFLRSNPSTLGEDLFKARIIEAHFEIIAKEDKEHIIEKKIDVILSLQSELASPEIKGSLDTYEDIGVDEISRSRPLLLMASLENTDVAMGKELKIQRRIWDPRIKIFLDNTLRTRSLHTLEVVPYPDTTPNRVVSIGAFIESSGEEASHSRLPNVKPFQRELSMKAPIDTTRFGLYRDSSTTIACASSLRI
ncbi:hypothetical protein Tco_0054208 [Tanacetum coccineum]